MFGDDHLGIKKAVRPMSIQIACIDIMHGRQLYVMHACMCLSTSANLYKLTPA